MISCPICTNSNLSVGKEYHFFEKTFTVYRCRQCDLIFTNPLPSLSELNSYYSSNSGINFSGYFHEYLKNNFENYLSNPPDYLNKTLEWLKTFIPSQSKERLTFLEIGSNLGLFGEIVSTKLPVTFYGVELNQEAVNFCRQRNKVNVSGLSFEENPFPGQYFDFIALFDVFEHLPDPRHFIRLMKQRLKAEGRILLAVPNTKTLEIKILRFFKRLRGKDIYPRVDPLFHLYGYNKDNLSQLFEENGFVQDSVQTYLYKSYGPQEKMPFKFTNLNRLIGWLISCINYLTKDDKLLISFKLKTKS